MNNGQGIERTPNVRKNEGNNPDLNSRMNMMIGAIQREQSSTNRCFSKAATNRLFVKSKMLFTLATLLLVPVAGIVSINLSRQEDHGQVLFTVMTYNIGVEAPPAPTAEEIASIVKKNDVPDVLLVQDASWEVKIRDIAHAIGYEYFISGRDTMPLSNLGILSRFPLSRRGSIHFYKENTRPSAIGADVDVHGRTVFVSSVHLNTLRNISGFSKNDGFPVKKTLEILWHEYVGCSPHARSVGRFLDWVSSRSFQHAVIAGDFNTTPLAQPIRMILKTFGDGLWPRLSYFRGTKIIAHKFLPNPRIDHIFYSNSLVCIDAEVMKNTAGDHYPIRAVFGFSSEFSRRDR